MPIHIRSTSNIDGNSPLTLGAMSFSVCSHFPTIVSSKWVNPVTLPPVPVEGGETIYAPVPVSFSVAVDAGGRVKSIEGDSPSPAGVADAARYIKTLRESGQLAAAGEAAPARGVTHQIERDAQGRHVLRRKRFSII